MFEKVFTKATILVMIIGLIFGLEQLHQRYFIPSVVREAREAQESAPTVTLDPGNNVMPAMRIDDVGALIMDCSCVKNPPTGVFERSGWRYVCAKTQMEFISSLRCFACIANKTRCPWDNQGLTMLGG